MDARPSYALLPSVDALLNVPAVQALSAAHGRSAVLGAARGLLQECRERLGREPDWQPPTLDELVPVLGARLEQASRPSLRRVFNLTGTVLHTGLGRAPLPQEAVEAVAAAMAHACNLEVDTASGRRGWRDAHVAALLCELTGAEAACVVNNNAGALFLALNTLALRKRVPVSRGELIEIGGSFRLPDIMARAGCRLVEVGTTNRTYLSDYRDALDPRTALLLQVHPSNFAIQGFACRPETRELAQLAAAHGLPLVVDLGSGALCDLAAYGLPHEPTPGEALRAGAQLITFSGDKLLGGPQAGLMVGRAELVRRMERNPLKRALRADKMTLAALEAVLRLYRQPERLAERLPTLRLLSRPRAAIEEQAQRLQPVLQQALPGWRVTVAACDSQIGTGAQPLTRLPSAALEVRPAQGNGGLDTLAARLRALPVPVFGRIQEGALILDLRCLDDEALLAEQFRRLGATP